MLARSAQQQLERIKASLSVYVEAAFSAYETKNGPFEISKNRSVYLDSLFDLYDSIIDRVIEEKSISILPLTFKITATLINLGFNLERFLELLITINEVTKSSYMLLGPRNLAIEQYLDTYISKIISSQDGLKYYLKGLTSEQLIQLVKEYAPSTTIINDILTEKQFVNNTIYTLFGPELYWETQKELYLKENAQTYRLAIYNEKLYVLNQGISKPNTTGFVFDEWGEFSSKYLIKKNIFNNKLKTNIELYVNSALGDSNDINAAISDSNIKSVETGLIYDEKDLAGTFAGRGGSIIKNILELKETIKYFGNSEASLVGSVDYIASFAEFLYACSYSRVVNGSFFETDGITAFGNFSFIFSYDFGVNKVAGLSFIESFKSLKSFKHKITLPAPIQLEEIDKNSFSIVYNPVYAKYNFGLKDRFINSPKNVYVDAPIIPELSDNYVVDVLLFGLQQIKGLSSILGDTIEGVSGALGSNGILPGYEGLGAISTQIEELKSIFIPSTELNGKYASSKVLPGFNGLLAYLLDSYRRLTTVVPNVPLTGESLKDLSIWARTAQKNLERLTTDIKTIGFNPGSFIPNISFKFSTLEQEALIDQLRSLNFQESEIIQFLSLENFEELVTKFAPISDSTDQISFFKGYELSQLIYEFGGESAISAYIDYLYSYSETGLVNLLEISLKNPTEAVTFNQNRYGKLIGLLINLTFAIDPEQLIIYKDYLSGNFLTLFESLTFLLQNQDTTLVKDKESINLLEPIVNSLIYGKSIFDLDSYNIDYATANENAPVALQQITELVDKNLGNTSTRLLERFFDKSVGLTYKELLTIINPQSATTELGQILSGAEGGKLTKLINYAYLSGLVHKLSYYTNSYQVPNFFVSPTSPIKLNELVQLIELLVFSLDLTITNFVNSLEYTVSVEKEQQYDFNNIFNLYNKTIDQTSEVIKNLTPIDQDITNFGSPKVSPKARIIGAPGIGNSPVPSGVSKINSITPEQLTQLAPVVKNNFSFIAKGKNNSLTEEKVAEKFISFIEENKLSLGTPSTNFIVVKNTEPSQEDIVDKSSNNSYNYRNVDSVNLLPESNMFSEQSKQDTENVLVSMNLLSKFDPVESCGRFGGIECSQRFNKNINDCGKINNRAIYPQEDISPSITKENGSIFVDRPLGGSIQNRSPKTFFPDGENNKPIYFNVLGDSVKITSGGQPLFDKITDVPLVFTKNSYSTDAVVESNSGAAFGLTTTDPDNELEKYYSSYYNSEYGLIEAIKAKWEKDDAFNCALLDDPYAYQACMNLLKSKRFKRTAGKPSLSFCPRILAGGIFK